MAKLRGKRDEDAAIAELMRLQTSLTDAGTTSESAAEIRKKATSGKGVLQGNEMEYWKKGFFKAESE